MSEVYVSSSIGSDSSAGTRENPVKTIATAMKKKPLQLFLRRGDTWYESLFAPAGLKVFDYDSANVPPTIRHERNGIKIRGNNVEIHRVRAQAIRTADHSTLFYGVDVIGNQILLDGVESIGWSYDFFIHSANDSSTSPASYANDVELRGIIARDAWGAGKSQGAYITHVNNLKMTGGCRFERCGFKTPQFTTADIFSHGVYAAEHNGPFIIDGVVVKNCGNYALQIRPGGTIRNFRIENCPCGIKAGQADSIIENGLIAGSRIISTTDRGAGWGIDTNRVPKLTIRHVTIGWKEDGIGFGDALQINYNDVPYSPNDAKGIIPKNPEVIIDGITIHEWQAVKAVKVQMRDGHFTMKDSRVMESKPLLKRGTKAFKPLGVQADFGSAAHEFPTNRFAYVNINDAAINGAAVDIPQRIPFMAMAKP